MNIDPFFVCKHKDGHILYPYLSDEKKQSIFSKMPIDIFEKYKQSIIDIVNKCTSLNIRVRYRGKIKNSKYHNNVSREFATHVCIYIKGK